MDRMIFCHECKVEEMIDDYYSDDWKCPRCNQPERSKREDDIMYLKCACGEYKHVFIDEIHMSRCGALNIVETQ